MANKNSFGFFPTTMRGLNKRQKIKRYARRQLILLPAHERLDPREKMFKKMWMKNRWRKRTEENEKR